MQTCCENTFAKVTQVAVQAPQTCASKSQLKVYDQICCAAKVDFFAWYLKSKMAPHLAKDFKEIAQSGSYLQKAPRFIFGQELHATFSAH